MNKKFLSAILFGALMVTSTGTFVSCKDYDDDIDRIDTELSDLKSQIAALQTEVSNGNWVTNLTPVDGGFTVSFKNGNTYTITNGKDGKPGDPGAPGTPGTAGKDGNTVEVKEGYWWLNGEKTEFVAVKKDDLGKALVPYVESGYWVFYDKDGKPQATDYKVWGNAWAVNNEGVWTLHMPDADGKDQTIELPTAAAKITGLSLGANKGLTLVANTAWNLKKGTEEVAASTWKGTRTLPAKGDVVYCSTNIAIDLRVNPVDVDGTEFDYTLVDAKNGTLDYVTLAASEYKDYNPLDRAAYGNGLYSLTQKNFVVGKDEANEFASKLTEISDRKYAVATGNHRTEYDVTVTTATSAPELSTVKVKDATETAAYLGSTDNSYTVKVGTKYSLEFDKAAALFDAYMTIDKQYVDAFGIVWDNATQTFTVGKNPDASTTDSNFPMTIFSVDNTGKIQETKVTIKLSTVIAPNKDYELITKNVSDNTKYFDINLATMKSNLGDNLNTWKLNADLSKTTYKLFTELENGKPKTTSEKSGVIDAGTGKLFQAITVSEVVNNDDKKTTNVNNANFIKVKIDNSKASAAGMKLNTTYYVEATFKNANSQELNTIVVPVKFTAPALNTMFAQKDGYVQDGVINAYFYKTDGNKKSVDVKEYFSKFVSDAKVILGDAIVGKTNKKTSELVKSLGNNNTFENGAIELNDDVTKAAPNNQFELGYGEVLEFKASKNNYEGWAYTTDAEKTYSFKMRLMSSIIEGRIASATGNVISINANDATTGAEITASMIKGYDYNGNAYNVVPDAINKDDSKKAAWANVFVKDVEPTEDADKYMKDVQVKTASKDSKGNIVPGAFVVTANALSKTVTVDMPVTVTDIWGYKKTDKVKVEIKKN